MPSNPRDDASTLLTQPEPLREAGGGQPVDLGDGNEGRYREGSLLGKGGMGEIWEWHDKRISRQVAGKVLRREHATSPRMQGRFLREAKIQGQLEHPSIVPVYDLGTTLGGDLYFTMKRVRGRTLRHVLGDLREGSAETRAAFSRRKILGAISAVCQVIDLAHRRGVVHRDIKPENVMLGDYGEVYLLDWGIAKVMNTTGGEAAAVYNTGAGETQGGTTPGTPHYMAPEQRKSGLVTERTDIYALGAILFESLSLEALHEHAEGDDPFASLSDERRGDIPPELATACRRAIASDPEARYASAAELHRALERYLDGDRDLELRRRLAHAHVEAARAASEKALAGAADQEEARRTAAAEVGRALGLEPENPEALGILLRLLTEPPRQLPAEPLAAAREEELGHVRHAARVGGFTYLAVLSLLVVSTAVLGGIQEPISFVVSCLLAAATTALCLARGTRVSPVGPSLVLTITACQLFAASLGRATGAAIFVPVLLAVNASIFAMHLGRRGRVLLAVGSVAAAVAPILLEIAGILPATMWPEGDLLIVRPLMFAHPSIPMLLLTQVLAIVLMCIILGTYRERMRDAEQRLHFQAWQLRQVMGAAPAAKRAG